MNELDVSKRLGEYSTPTLAEASSSVVALPPSIAPLYRPIHLSGLAYPVAAGPNDNLAVHLAVAEAPSGSILVVATAGNVKEGFWGEILMEAALARGIKGLVTDGAVRDTRALRERAFPVFCAGIAIPGTSKTSPGVLHEPIMLMQVLIRPGDFLVGDDDGVVVVPSDSAVPVLRKSEARVSKEATLIQRLREGELTIDLLSLRRPNARESG